MKSAFLDLMNVSWSEKEKRGLEFTPPEIAQQPKVWLKTVAQLKGQQKEIKAFLKKSGLSGKDKATLIFVGAGTSEFVGNSVYHGLKNRLNRETISIPTTHFVTNPLTMLVKDSKYVVCSFARSGDSPESVATYNIIKRFYKNAKQLVITCNKNGALAKRASTEKGQFCIVLPDETNDKSLVMTSSFSTMAMTAMSLGYINNFSKFEKEMKLAAAAGERVLSVYGNLLAKLGKLPFDRACFLGSGNLYGTMQECHLKMQEMTEGRVASRFDSFLGLRHGPQVFINKKCITVAAVSSDRYVRRYELDLLQQIKKNKQGVATLIICDKADKEIKKLSPYVVELFPKGKPIADDLRVLTDVMVGQILGTFKSMAVGLKPDNPSTSGTINRVVKGVTIYQK